MVQVRISVVLVSNLWCRSASQSYWSPIYGMRGWVVSLSARNLESCGTLHLISAPTRARAG